MPITIDQLSSLLAIPGAARQVCDLLNSIQPSEQSGNALTTDSTGSFSTDADITTSGELKSANLQVTNAANFTGATVTGLTLTAATKTEAGVVKMTNGMDDLAQSTATDVAGIVADHNTLVNNFNNLLGFMAQAGQMSS